MGREQWFLIPKGEISLLEIRSKIERQGVQKRREFFNPLRFLFISEHNLFRVLSIIVYNPFCYFVPVLLHKFRFAAVHGDKERNNCLCILI